MSLDPDCIRVHELYALAKRPPLEQQTPAEARDGMARGKPIFQPDPPPMAEIRDMRIPGPAGQIPIRLYRPAGSATATALPALVFYHGGGWVIGDLESHDTLCRLLSNSSGAAVIAVDYRLAPEHRFPAAVDDSWAALTWVHANAATLGIDGSRLAVGGDSAGGNLAAVMTLMARDGKGPALRSQLLIYPVTDCVFGGASFETRKDILPLTDKAMIWFREHYFGVTGDAVAAARDWRASPKRAQSHTGLPPALVLTAGYDVLCDDGMAYADLLERSGVAVERRHYPGMIHGFIGMGRIVGAAADAVAACAGALRSALA